MRARIQSLCSDEYLVIKDESLLPKRHADPAEYEGVDPKKLDRDSTIDDICDFFVEYMQSDIVVCSPCPISYLDYP